MKFWLDTSQAVSEAKTLLTIRPKYYEIETHLLHETTSIQTYFYIFTDGAPDFQLVANWGDALESFRVNLTDKRSRKRWIKAYMKTYPTLGWCLNNAEAGLTFFPGIYDFIDPDTRSRTTGIGCGASLPKLEKLPKAKFVEALVADETFSIMYKLLASVCGTVLEEYRTLQMSSFQKNKAKVLAFMDRNPELVEVFKMVAEAYKPT
jgi:hypothetical protein